MATPLQDRHEGGRATHHEVGYEVALAIAHVVVHARARFGGRARGLPHKAVHLRRAVVIVRN